MKDVSPTPPTMIKQLAHLCILSADLQKTEDFYCGVLGLKKKFEFKKEGRLFGFYLEVSPMQFIEFFQTGEDKRDKGNLITHLCLEVEDINALTAHFDQHNISYTKPLIGSDQAWQTWCTDPDGTAIEFHQYTPESSQYTGRECIVTW